MSIMEHGVITFWMTVAGTLCWGVCFVWMHRISARQDALLYCNAANALFTWMPRVTGMRVALNVDGLERNRKKWNRIAKAWYQVSEWLATWMPK